MELTNKQKSALESAVKWYKESSNQIFTIGGYAGTGKTFIVKEIVKELGDAIKVVSFCTFTGKASLVLTKKGNPASTIHRLIYEPKEITEDVLNEKGEVLYKKKKMVFVKKTMLDPLINLIIIDEVSMVNNNLLNDIKSFGIKIIAIGDVGQLPPIGDKNNLLDNPDVFLDEIHRQAEDNPIIYLSMLARQGKRIDIGSYGKKVVVIHKDQLTEGMYMRADQVLCGRNTTRAELNKYMREAKGIDSEVPIIGDKLICTKNNWKKSILDISLINGLVGYVKDLTEVNTTEGIFRFDFIPDFIENDYFEGIYGNLSNFIKCKNPNKKNTFNESSMDFENDSKSIKFDFRKLRKYDIHSEFESESENKVVDEFEFGYAITVHKSQGSEWGKVLVYNEYLSPKDQNKWLYTAITRSSDRLILAL